MNLKKFFLMHSFEGLILKKRGLSFKFHRLIIEVANYLLFANLILNYKSYIQVFDNNTVLVLGHLFQYAMCVPKTLIPRNQY